MQPYCSKVIPILIGVPNCDGIDEQGDNEYPGIKIGLEIHCQLTGLQSKLFCSCFCNYHGLEPNGNICPICCGLPGTLPLLNKTAVESACMVSLALDCKIPDNITFYRKNYFYPIFQKTSN